MLIMHAVLTLEGQLAPTCGNIACIHSSSLCGMFLHLVTDCSVVVAPPPFVVFLLLHHQPCLFLFIMCDILRIKVHNYLLDVYTQSLLLLFSGFHFPASSRRDNLCCCNPLNANLSGP